MRLIENLNIKKVGKEYLAIVKTKSGLDYTRVISLNESAVFLIESIKNEAFEITDWQKMLTEKYNIASERAYNDAKKLAGSLIDAGVLIV